VTGRGEDQFGGRQGSKASLTDALSFEIQAFALRNSMPNLVANAYQSPSRFRG